MSQGRGTVRKLTADDLPKLARLREVSFPGDPEDERLRERQARLLPYQRGFFVGDSLSSSARMLPFAMALGGRFVKMGGLASVQSAAEFRRRGHVRALLHHLLEELRAEGVGFCLEYPFDPRYYGRLGWQSVVNGAVLSVPPERLGEPQRSEARRIEAESLPEATEERLEPLYRNWAAGYNGSLDRGRGAVRPFAEVIAHPWDTRLKLAYELDGAYCILAFEHDPSQLSVVDYAFASPEGRKRLLGFLALFAGQAARVHLHLPADDPLLADLQPFVRPNPQILQARVVDVQRALSALAPALEARFALRVHDDFCVWNNATTLLEFTEGRVRFKPWAQSPDVDIDVRGLATLLMGGLSAEAAMRAGLASGSPEALRALASLSGGRTVFMPRADYF